MHRLPDTLSVIEWVKGTLLTQYRRTSASETYEEFLERYRSELLDELGDPDGQAALHPPVQAHPLLGQRR